MRNELFYVMGNVSSGFYGFMIWGIKKEVDYGDDPRPTTE